MQRVACDICAISVSSFRRGSRAVASLVAFVHGRRYMYVCMYVVWS